MIDDCRPKKRIIFISITIDEDIEKQIDETMSIFRRVTGKTTTKQKMLRYCLRSGIERLKFNLTSS